MESEDGHLSDNYECNPEPRDYTAEKAPSETTLMGKIESNSGDLFCSPSHSSDPPPGLLVPLMNSDERTSTLPSSASIDADYRHVRPVSPLKQAPFAYGITSLFTGQASPMLSPFMKFTPSGCDDPGKSEQSSSGQDSIKSLTTFAHGKISVAETPYTKHAINEGYCQSREETLARHFCLQVLSRTKDGQIERAACLFCAAFSKDKLFREPVQTYQGPVNWHWVTNHISRFHLQEWQDWTLAKRGFEAKCERFWGPRIQVGSTLDNADVKGTILCPDLRIDSEFLANAPKLTAPFRTLTERLQYCVDLDMRDIFGLSVLERSDNGKIELAACRFCAAFGCQGRVEGNLKLYAAPINHSTCRKHLERAHSQKWTEYQTLQLAADSAKSRALFWASGQQLQSMRVLLRVEDERNNKGRRHKKTSFESSNEDRESLYKRQKAP